MTRPVRFLGFLLFILVLLPGGSALAQGSSNMTLVGSQDIHSGYNDIWGYTDEFGTEYALLGVVDGTSIVNISNPAAPVETGFIPASLSIWRDMKTFGDFAYLVTEGGGGMQIINLTDPENPILVATYNGFDSAHNIYIEEATARAYACGMNNANGGVHVMDLTVPIAPIFVGAWSGSYVHDLYVENNIAYLAEIDNASLSVVDFNNPASPFRIAGPQSYPTAFTHNTWLTQGGDYVLTTDENLGGRIRVWDIQNLPTLTQVAEWQTPETNSIVHNVLVDGDFAYASYYSEGTRVLDVSDPTIPVEIAWYDNFSGPSGDFDGVWGVYPYLPSGRVLSSDQEQGLLIFEVGNDWAKVSGVVTEQGVGGILEGAQVELVEPANSTTSSSLGKYALVSTPGTYTLRATLEGFFDHEEPVTIANGAPLTVDIELIRRPNGPVTGTIQAVGVVSNPLFPLADADVELVGTAKADVTDASGAYAMSQVAEDTYLMRVTRAGFGQVDLPITATEAGRTYDLDLDVSPWYDSADAANGWSLSDPGDQAITGLWVRADPVGSSLGGTQVQPGNDASPPQPLGPTEAASSGVCYVTGNANPGDSIGTNDIDGGATTLTSPQVDLTGYADPLVAYSRWYSNEAGANPGSDIFLVEMSDDNGASWTMVESLFNDANQWTRVVFRVQDFVGKTDQFRIRFVAADDFPGSVVEAAIDDLEFFDRKVTATPGVPKVAARLRSIAPNPFNPRTMVHFEIGQAGRVDLGVYDLRGRHVATLVAEDLPVGNHLRPWDGVDHQGRSVASGVYFAVLESGGVRSTRKLVLAK